MATTQSAYDWLRSHIAPTTRPEGEHARERDARVEIDRLRAKIASLVGAADRATPLEALDAALGAAARLQVVTANLDACDPPKGADLSRSLVTFADSRLFGHTDAIERGMRYTADSTIRTLRGD
jgi:hypothetical protein